jgi:hypothetical protein
MALAPHWLRPGVCSLFSDVFFINVEYIQSKVIVISEECIENDVEGSGRGLT